MLKIKITLIFFACTLTLVAQEFPAKVNGLDHRVGLAVGIGTVSWLDKNSSPLSYASKPKNVRIFYHLEGESMLYTFDITVKVGSTKAKHVHGRMVYFQEENYQGKKEEKKFPVGGSFLSGVISLGAFYKWDRASDTQIATGIKLSNEMFYPQGWVSSGMFNALAISPAAHICHVVDIDQMIDIAVSVPIATYLARLPYHNTVSAPNKSLVEGFMSNSKWKGLAGFFAPSIALQYHRQFNTQWGSSLGYHFNYYGIRSTMKATSHTLLGSIYNQF